MAETFYPGGNQPQPTDEPWDLLQKIALTLYAAFGMGMQPPDYQDTSEVLVYRIAAYLYQGSVTPIVTPGGGDNDAYRIVDGQIQLWNVDQQVYQTVSLAGAPGEERLVIGESS